jgi:hypothetical protein
MVIVSVKGLVGGEMGVRAGTGEGDLGGKCEATFIFLLGAELEEETSEERRFIHRF